MGLVQRVKGMGVHVCAFGWTAVGPVRQLIETSGLNGWLGGPSYGSGIDIQELAQLIGLMQTLRKFSAPPTAGA